MLKLKKKKKTFQGKSVSFDPISGSLKLDFSECSFCFILGRRRRDFSELLLFIPHNRILLRSSRILTSVTFFTIFLLILCFINAMVARKFWYSNMLLQIFEYYNWNMNTWCLVGVQTRAYMIVWHAICRYIALTCHSFSYLEATKLFYEIQNDTRV